MGKCDRSLRKRMLTTTAKKLKESVQDLNYYNDSV